MYEFKVDELGWAALVAASIVVLEALAALDPAAVLAEPVTYLIALGGGAIRAAAGAVLAMMKPSV